MAIVLVAINSTMIQQLEVVVAAMRTVMHVMDLEPQIVLVATLVQLILQEFVLAVQVIMELLVHVELAIYHVFRAQDRAVQSAVLADQMHTEMPIMNVYVILDTGTIVLVEIAINVIIRA